MPSAACRAVDDAAAHLHPEMQRTGLDESGAVTYLVRGDQIRSVNSCAAPSHRCCARSDEGSSVEAAGFPLDTPTFEPGLARRYPTPPPPSIRLTRESPSINTVRSGSDLRRCLSPPKPDLVEQPHRLGQSPAAGSASHPRATSPSPRPTRPRHEQHWRAEASRERRHADDHACRRHHRPGVGRGAGSGHPDPSPRHGDRDAIWGKWRRSYRSAFASSAFIAGSTAWT